MKIKNERLSFSHSVQEITFTFTALKMKSTNISLSSFYQEHNLNCVGQNRYRSRFSFGVDRVLD